MKQVLILSILFFTSIFAQNNYCIGLRGNGELIPAHWGALSHTIETFGVPQAMAGGSSASVSTFFVDQLMQNEFIESESDPVQKAIKLAFLVKSIQGYIYARLSQPEWQSFVQFVKGATHSEESLLQQLDNLLSDMSYLKIRQIIKVVGKIRESKVFYGPSIEKFDKKLSEFSYFSWDDWTLLKTYAKQIRISISLIGKFDAKNDASLLIRDGVINFPAISEQYARVASFYRLIDATPLLKLRFGNYMKMCSTLSVGKTWDEFVSKNRFCQSALEILTNQYFSETYVNTSHVLDAKMGQGLGTLVTAGFVQGDSASVLRRSKAEFEMTFAEDAGDVVLSEKDIFFGYVGNEDRLRAVEKSFSDKPSPYLIADKSRRFKAMGHATWRMGLDISANEPGLGAYTEKLFNGNKVLAIGGWTDLHPMPVLKASGCEKVVYVNRIGGDTIFGQGLAKRIFNFDNIPWEDLDPYEPNLSKNQKLNNNGRPEDQTSLWSNMYNLANPNSSYAYSISLADAVVCTNWNNFDVTKQFSELIRDSYNAPIYNPSQLKTLNVKLYTEIKKEANEIDAKTGFYRYSGCIPLPN